MRHWQWWIGDWLVEGESVYGSKYEAALHVTGLAYGSLRNLKWVAEQVDVSRRRDTLSYSHHVEVAALEPKEQRVWLDRAERDNLTRDALREAIAASRQLPAPVLTLPVRITISQVAPDRAERWRQAAEDAGVERLLPIVARGGTHDTSDPLRERARRRALAADD